MIDITRQYVFTAKNWPPGGMTHPGAVEFAVGFLAATWNAHVPTNHVRIMTSTRFREMAHTLRTLTVRQAERAIRCYASQKWQRSKGAWKRFENFAQLDVIGYWWEQAAEAEERETAKRAAKTPQGRKVRGITAGIGGREVDAELLDRFIAYAPDEQAELLAQAVKEVGELRPSIRERLFPTLKCHAVKMQLLTIMRRKGQPQSTQRKQR